MQKNRITQSVIIGLTTLVATATWAGLEGVLSKSGNWILPIVGFFILLIFLSLNWLLTKSKIILLITLFFVLISFLFSFGFKLGYLALLFVVFLIFFFASERVFNEKNIRIKIDVIRILRRGLPLIITGLCLIIAVAYHFSPLAFQGQNQIVVPRPIFDKIASPIIGNIEKQLPILQFSPLEEDNIYQTLNKEINRHSQSYKEYFSLGLTIGFFFALRTIGAIFGWLVILLTWAIFKILVAVGAIKIQEQAVLKEVIEV